MNLFLLNFGYFQPMPLAEDATLEERLFAEESLTPLDALRLDEVLKTRPPFYFVGIGGAGMSALALAMQAKGFDVSGSDVNVSSTTQRLQETGITVFQGHLAEQVPENAVVVLSTAIDEANPELRQAITRQQPLWHRSQVLQSLMHSPSLGMTTTIGLTGTHGKTTLTGLMDSVLHQANYPAMSIAGGKLPQLGQNIRLAEGATTCVAELDESDGTILRYAPTFTILANLELDHADHYTDGLTHLLHTFERFFRQLTSFNTNPTPTVVLNGQCENTLKIIHALPENVHRLWLFDDKARAEAFAETGHRYLIKTEDGGFSLWNYTASGWEPLSGEATGRLQLSIPGHHNVWNASMVAIVSHQLGLAFDDIVKGLASFTGMGRRFEVLGRYKNALWVDDYAHHPTEVRVTLEASRQRMTELNLNGKLVACFQPHRYTRLQALWDGFLEAFESADVVYIIDTYHAFEAPISGIDSSHFVDALKAKYPQQQIAYAPDLEALKAELQATAEAGDLILSMGAGTITSLLRSFPFEENGGHA
jgi:UDP-N-acetylmuramate--alanine ligase